MAITTPVLDLIILDTHNTSFLAIGDGSVYPTNFNAISPSLQITPPGYSLITLTFIAGGVQIYNAESLSICLDSCPPAALPDGIYTFKYMISPFNVYNVTKQFFRTEQITSDLDAAFLKLNLFECDGRLLLEKKNQIELIQFYIQGAIAASNQCALKLATDLYNKARTLLDCFVNNLQCNF